MTLGKFVTVLVTLAMLIVSLAVGTTRAEKLLVGYSGISADLSHLWIANEAGLFKKHGVEVVPIYFSGGKAASVDRLENPRRARQERLHRRFV